MKNKMKTLLVVMSWLAAGLSVSNAQSHRHVGDEGDRLVAPNGGRLVKSVEPNAEVFVAEDGLVRITFLADDGSVVAPAGQDVSLIGGNRMDPIQLSFSLQGNVLVSDGKLPLEAPIPVVVQIKATADAKVVRERFQLNMSSCPSCEYKEYACACHEEVEEVHSHGGGHGHSH